MAVENITLNIIPTGDTPSIHVAQFDVDRPFTITLKEGADDFTPTDYTIELQVRKVDATIVTVLPTSTSGNVVTFNTTEQMTACSGTNLAEVQLTKDSQTFATLHFYLVVQRDVLAGGVTSESDIYNLTEQIAAIVPEVIGDDYYNKEEVDEKIAEIPTFDPTNYYDKSDVDTLLNGKADVSDLPDMSNYYDKSETDALLSDKADKSVVDAIKLLPTVKSVSGSVATFDTDLTDNLIECKCDIVYSQASGTPTPSDPLPITVYTSLNLSHSDDDTSNPTVTNIPFGRTVAKGNLNVKTGVLTITHGYKTINDLTFNYESGNTRFITSISDLKPVGVRLTPFVTSTFFSVDDGRPIANVPDNSIYSSNTTTVYIKCLSYTDPVAFKSAFSTTQIVYPIEPVVFQLLPTEVTQLLNENNIWCDTNGDTSVKYSLTIGKAIS